MRLARPFHLIPLAALAVLAGCKDETPDAALIEVPSGRQVSLIDVVTNVPGPDGATARFRFLVPGLGADDIETTADDMQALCDRYALPRTDGMVPAPQQIVITLAAEAVPFGQPAPGVVQFFEAYRIEAGSCVWAPF